MVFDRLFASQLMKHLAILTSGAALAQVVGVLAAPVLSRLYSPEEFGHFGTLMAIAGVVTVVGSLKYEMALVVEQDERKVVALQFLCFYVLLAVTMLSALGLTATLYFGALSGYPALSQFLPYGLVVVFSTGLFGVFSYRLNRERAYKLLALANVVQRGGTVASQIVLGFCGATTLGLIFGNIAGFSLALGVVFFGFRKEFKLGFRSPCSRVEILAVAAKHYRFPAFSAPQNFLNALSQNLPVFILGYFFDAQVVGSYWFAMRILQLPAGLIGQSVRQVFFKESSAISADSAAVRRLFRKLTLGLAALIVLPVLLVFLFGPTMFDFVFGSSWLQAGEFSRWMFLWVGVGFCTPPATCIFSVYGFQKQFMMYDLFLLVARGGALLCGGIFGLGPVNTIILYSAVGIIFNLSMICYSYSKIERGAGFV